MPSDPRVNVRALEWAEYPQLAAQPLQNRRYSLTFMPRRDQAIEAKLHDSNAKILRHVSIIHQVNSQPSIELAAQNSSVHLVGFGNFPQSDRLARTGPLIS